TPTNFATKSWTGVAPCATKLGGTTPKAVFMNQALLGTQRRPELTCVQNGATTASVIPQRSFTLTAVGVMHGATAFGPAGVSLVPRPNTETKTQSFTKSPRQSRRES